MPDKAMVIDLARIDQLFAAAARASALNLIQDLQVNADGTVALTGDGSRYASIRADQDLLSAFPEIWTCESVSDVHSI